MRRSVSTEKIRSSNDNAHEHTVQHSRVYVYEYELSWESNVFPWSKEQNEGEKKTYNEFFILNL